MKIKTLEEALKIHDERYIKTFSGEELREKNNTIAEAAQTMLELMKAREKLADTITQDVANAFVTLAANLTTEK